MRIRAEFYIEKETEFPYHLNHALSSFLYQCISKADEKLGTWLHEEGLFFQGRFYKPIHFSAPFFEMRKNRRGYMVVKGKMALQIGSILPPIIHRLIEGLWKVRCFRFMDLLIPLAGIQIVPPAEFRKKMAYRAVSPIVVPISKEGRLHYCHPLESRFYDSLRRSLGNWYHLRWDKPRAEEGEIHITLLHPEGFQMKRAAVLTRYKEKNIKGYKIPLLIEAPPPVQQVAYEAGLGSYGSQGFGMIEEIPCGEVIKNRSNGDPRQRKGEV